MDSGSPGSKICIKGGLTVALGFTRGQVAFFHRIFKPTSVVAHAFAAFNSTSKHPGKDHRRTAYTSSNVCHREIEGRTGRRVMREGKPRSNSHKDQDGIATYHRDSSRCLSVIACEKRSRRKDLRSSRPLYVDSMLCNLIFIQRRTFPS
jgi:hypothetical protein